MFFFRERWLGNGSIFEIDNRAYDGFRPQADT
jgi:hypothetical protein